MMLVRGRWFGASRGRWRRIADGLTVLILAGAAIWIIRALLPATVYPTVSVIDGDSLRAGSEEIRLHGIDAPEYRQSCEDRSGRSYACGKRAAQHLRKLVGTSPVSCKVIDTDRYERTIGVCSVGATELNEAMVEAGWAVAYSRHSLSYMSTESAARRARRGIWQGRFASPEDWRDSHRTGLVSED